MKKISYLGFGGNIGEPRKAMAEALCLLDEADGVDLVQVSSLYRTPPWGKVDQPDFLNAAAKVATRLSPRALLNLCLEVEHRLKRVRTERWGPRSIDIDVLWYDGLSIDEEGLQIPHPRMLQRAFVLLPLAEIEPTLDLAGKTARERCVDIDAAGIVRQTENGDWWRAQER